VRGLGGAAHPGWFTLRRRLSEVEIHHVDLGAGYRPADWPDAFTAELVKSVASDFGDDDLQPAALVSTNSGETHQIGPPGAPAGLAITGADWLLLAWLTGRSPGDGLTVEPAGPLPALPAW
jgi:maleylpyruvate isomerase